jgi:hypothetical protein
MMAGVTARRSPTGKRAEPGKRRLPAGRPSPAASDAPGRDAHQEDPERAIHAQMRWDGYADMVELWARQLERQHGDFTRSAERWSRTEDGRDLGSRWAAKARETAAVLEVVSRGLDPGGDRLFHGRVSLTIRCQQRGHVLARVYPTRLYPVLIPSVRALPLGDRTAWKQRQRDATEQVRVHFPWSPGAVRDPWLQASAGAGDEPDIHLPGLTVLRNWHRSDQIFYEQLGWVRPTVNLICRCGEQMMAVADVMRALDANVDAVVAVYTDGQQHVVY